MKIVIVIVIVIVGGVVGGASCAARLRRLDEHAQILMVDRGPCVSYTNCDLPYHVGDVIEQESALLLAEASAFTRWSGVAPARWRAQHAA
jgi:NADPH-dependent 2,4-dienoyl-CoA reductase/sulfur reductase-like enzyme